MGQSEATAALNMHIHSCDETKKPHYATVCTSFPTLQHQTAIVAPCYLRRAASRPTPQNNPAVTTLTTLAFFSLTPFSSIYSISGVLCVHDKNINTIKLDKKI